MKFFSNNVVAIAFHVTPCVGVWIEIAAVCDILDRYAVTPCVGVWIEIDRAETINNLMGGSLPAWECGLKFYVAGMKIMSYMSLPAWECGLKSKKEKSCGKNITVTPCVGVWIEISRTTCG